MDKIKEVRSEISKRKTKLKKKAEQKGGVWENFGQKDVRELNSMYYTDVFTSKEIRTALRSFNNWCMNYTTFGGNLWTD